mmetsp:Transcript_11725/g.21149  ORF Transcript_11725/g.21149 Transcript_11725/m.21149 type:complete len:303 (+) Transcript_11725:160-1068(+)
MATRMRCKRVKPDARGAVAVLEEGDVYGFPSARISSSPILSFRLVFSSISFLICSFRVLTSLVAAAKSSSVLRYFPSSTVLNPPPFSLVWELSSSSPSGTGEGGAGGATNDTLSFMSVILAVLLLSKRSAGSSGLSLPLVGVSAGNGTVSTRNLSLQLFKSGGNSFCACMITCTSALPPALTTPVLGRTMYFFGLVVFTLNATATSFPLFTVSVTGICFRSSNRNLSSEGDTVTPASAILSHAAVLRPDLYDYNYYLFSPPPATVSDGIMRYGYSGLRTPTALTAPQPPGDGESQQCARVER